MAVKRVDTLGCHPLVLMKKMAAIDGLEILKEEKHVHDGVEYPYHIVAKVKDGLYVEAKDPIYEFASTPELLPRSLSYDADIGTAGHVLGLEASATDLTKTVIAKDEIVIIESQESLPNGALGLSLLFAYQQGKYGGSPSTFAYQIFTGGKSDSGTDPLFGGYPSGNKERAMRIGEKNPIGPAYYGDTRDYYFMGIKALEDLAFPFGATTGLVMSAFFENITWQAKKYVQSGVPETPRLCFGLSSTFNSIGGAPLLLSGTVMRTSSSISTENELVSASPWRCLPITPSIIKGDGGLFFFYDEGDAYTGVLGVVLVDTTMCQDICRVSLRW